MAVRLLRGHQENARSITRLALPEQEPPLVPLVDIIPPEQGNVREPEASGIEREEKPRLYITQRPLALDRFQTPDLFERQFWLDRPLFPDPHREEWIFPRPSALLAMGCVGGSDHRALGNLLLCPQDTHCPTAGFHGPG